MRRVLSLLTLLFLFSGSSLFAELGGITMPPGGVNGSMQFNRRGLFGGTTDFIYSTGTKILTVPAISGDGSRLTNLSTATIPSGASIAASTNALAVQIGTTGADLAAFHSAVSVSTAALWVTIGSTYAALNTTGAALSGLTGAVQTATAALTTRMGNLDTSTGALTVRLGNLDSSTATLTTRAGNLDSSTTTLTTRLNNVDTSTTSLTGRLNNLDTSTAALTIRIGNLDSSTSTLTGRLNALDTSTTTLSGSTSTLLSLLKGTAAATSTGFQNVVTATSSLQSNLYNIVSTNIVGGLSSGSSVYPATAPASFPFSASITSPTIVGPLYLSDGSSVPFSIPKNFDFVVGSAPGMGAQFWSADQTAFSSAVVQANGRNAWIYWQGTSYTFTGGAQIPPNIRVFFGKGFSVGATGNFQLFSSTGDGTMQVFGYPRISANITTNETNLVMINSSSSWQYLELNGSTLPTYSIAGDKGPIIMTGWRPSIETYNHINNRHNGALGANTVIMVSSAIGATVKSSVWEDGTNNAITAFHIDGSSDCDFTDIQADLAKFNYFIIARGSVFGGDSTYGTRIRFDKANIRYQTAGDATGGISQDGFAQSNFTNWTVTKLGANGGKFIGSGGWTGGNKSSGNIITSNFGYNLDTFATIPAISSGTLFDMNKCFGCGTAMLVDSSLSTLYGDNWNGTTPIVRKIYGSQIGAGYGTANAQASLSVSTGGSASLVPLQVSTAAPNPSRDQMQFEAARTSVTVYVPLVLATVTAPTVTTNGQVFQDSVQENISVYVNNLKQSVGTTIWSATATKTVTNTALETPILLSTGGVGTLSLPANFWTIGKTIRLMGGGIYSTPIVPGNIIIKIKQGSTEISVTTTSALVGSIANGAFSFLAQITCRATGASGSVMPDGHINYATTAGARGFDDFDSLANPTAIDTTAAGDLSLTVKWDTADASKSMSMTVATIEVLN